MEENKDINTEYNEEEYCNSEYSNPEENILEEDKEERVESSNNKKKTKEKEVKQIPIGFGILKKKPILIPQNKKHYNEILLIGNLRGLFGEWEEKMEEDEGHPYPIVNGHRDYWSQEGRDNLYWLRQCLEEGASVTIIECLRPTDPTEDTYFDRVKQYMLWSLLNKKICEAQFTHIKVVTDEKGKFNLNEYINKNMKKKFDICIMNAPYERGLHEKFEATGIDMVTEEIIWIGPLTWLIAKNQNKELCERCDQFYTSIKTIDPKDHFDALIGQKMAVVTVNKKKGRYIEYNGIAYSKCSEIRHFSDDILIASAYRKIQPYNFTDNLHNRLNRTVELNGSSFKQLPKVYPNDSEYVFRIPAIQGNVKAFYTFISKDFNYTEYSGLYSSLKDKKNRLKEPFVQYYIKLANEKQCENFWKFVRTDFCQLCLYFIKTNPNLNAGELKFIPWLDWNQEYDDMKLFKMFNLNKKEVERVYEVIPNYFSNQRKKLLEEYDKDLGPLRPY